MITFLRENNNLTSLVLAETGCGAFAKGRSAQTYNPSVIKTVKASSSLAVNSSVFHLAFLCANAKTA